MGWPTLLGIAVALAMDAFAVALGAGITLTSVTPRHLFRLGFHFGLFQALMPVLGWLAGMSIHRWISAFDHWVAFVLLVLVGVRMIREAGSNNAPGAKRPSDPTRGWTLLVLSVATSIDALAVGLSLAALGVAIWAPALLIGIVCAALTVAGMLLGSKIGALWGKKVEIFGGVLLILIGIRILADHFQG